MYQYISTRHILYLYLEAERHPGEVVSKQWWEKMGLHLELARGGVGDGGVRGGIVIGQLKINTQR